MSFYFDHRRETQNLSLHFQPTDQTHNKRKKRWRNLPYNHEKMNSWKTAKEADTKTATLNKKNRRVEIQCVIKAAFQKQAS